MSQEDPWGFKCIFHEVCVMDCYRLRELPFVPDVIVDIGAMVGVFTSYARYLFPSAEIVAVEPDPQNWQHLNRFVGHLPGVTLIKKALGTGPMWHSPTDHILAAHNKQWPEGEAPYYGGSQSYTTLDQLGYPESWLQADECFEPAPGIEAVSLDALVADYVPEGAKSMLKIDCEGGENCIFDHEPSMAALRRMDAIAMEVHGFTKGTVEEYEVNKKLIWDRLMGLSDTHLCSKTEPLLFHAVRKEQ